MGERGPAGPTDEDCLKAWELNVRGNDLPKIAEQLQISVSTARRWRNRGRSLATELVWGADGELRKAALQERALAAFQLARKVLIETTETGDSDPVQAMLAVIKSIEVEARVLGYAAPAASTARVDITAGQRQAAGPEPIVVDAVDDYHAARARGEIT